MIRSIVEGFKNLNPSVKVLVIVSLLAGSAIRFIELFHEGYVFDTISTQYTWAKNADQMGLINFWTDYAGHFDYLPLSLIFLEGSYWVSKIFGGSDLAFVAVLKSIFWIVEILFSLFIIFLNKRFGNGNVRRGFLLASLFYVLPSLWFVSASWGQMDSLIAILGLLAIFLLYRKNKVGFCPWYKDSIFWAGTLWSITLWIKLQPVLMLPVILLVFLGGKSIRNILKTLWVVVPNFLALLGAGLYYKLSGLEEKLPAGSIFEDQRMTNLVYIVSAILISNLVYLFYKINKKDAWLSLRRFVAGVVLIFSLVVVPFGLLSPYRIGANTFGAVMAGSGISGSASTFWKAIRLDWQPVSTALVKIGNFEISAKLVGLIIFSSIMLILLSWYIKKGSLSIQNLKNLNTIIFKKLTFVDAILALAVSCSAYYVFMVGRMHSRYLHLGLVFALTSLALIKIKKGYKQWVSLVLVMQVAYFLNQLSVFQTSFYIYPENWPDGAEYSLPNWIDSFYSSFGFDLTTFGGVLNTLIVVGMIVWSVWYYKNKTISVSE